MSKRFYADYRDWEDYKAGMFGTEVKNEQVQKSKALLSSPELHKQMLQVVYLWVISSKHNLSNLSSNRRSWLGQSACCISHGATEYETRLAWKELTKDQQFEANRLADLAILEWEQQNNFIKENYVKEDFTL